MGSLIRDRKITDLLSQVEKSTWNSLKSVIPFFFYGIIKHKLLWDLGSKVWVVICPTRFIFWTLKWISSLAILILSVINIFIKTFQIWKRGSRDFFLSHICCVLAAKTINNQKSESFPEIFPLHQKWNIFKC